jgi:hypothetical protein
MSNDAICDLSHPLRDLDFDMDPYAMQIVFSKQTFKVVWICYGHKWLCICCFPLQQILGAWVFTVLAVDLFAVSHLNKRSLISFLLFGFALIRRFIG